MLVEHRGRVDIGARCVIMENSLVRARAAHPVRLGDDVPDWFAAHRDDRVV